VVEDGLGTDAEEQQKKKQQLEYEEAMKLLELLQGLSHRTYHWFYQICWLLFDFDCSLPFARTQLRIWIRCKPGCTGVIHFFVAVHLN